MKKTKRIFLVLTVLSMVLSAMPSGSVYGEERPKAKDIPNKTIIIGTYIISLEALNSEILKVARDSAVKNNQNVQQNNIYFKSDVNKGVWYDITDGGDITNISVTTDNLVSDETIDNLVLTHYTKPNGQTVEFETGRTISVSNIQGVNIPSNMEELEQLVQEREILAAALENTEDEDEDEAAIYARELSSVGWVLSPIGGKTYDDYTNSLSRLDSLIDFLRNNKNAPGSLIELVVAEKMYILTEREIYCYDTEVNRLDFELGILNYQNNSGLIQKYSDALTSLKAEMLELETNTKEQPVNSVDAVYEKYSRQMLNLVNERDFEGAYTGLLKMNAVNNLRIEVIEDKPLEIEMAKEARKDALKKLDKKLNSGGSKEYKKAVKDGEHREILAKLKQESILECELYMNELNTIAGYIIMRTDSAKEKALEAKKTEAAYEEMSDSLAESDLKEGLLASLSAEYEKAKETADGLKLAAAESYLEAKKDVDALTKEADALNEKYLGAMEENQQADAESYKEQLQKTQASLIAAQKRLEDVTAMVKAQDDFAVNTEIISPVEGVLEELTDLFKEISSAEKSSGGALDTMLAEGLSNIEEEGKTDTEVMTAKAEVLKAAINKSLESMKDSQLQNNEKALESIGELTDRLAGLQERLQELEKKISDGALAGEDAQTPKDKAKDALKSLLDETKKIQAELFALDSNLFDSPQIYNDLEVGAQETVASLKQKTETLKDIINKNLENMKDSQLQNNEKALESIGELTDSLVELQEGLKELEKGLSDGALAEKEVQASEDKAKDALKSLLDEAKKIQAELFALENNLFDSPQAFKDIDVGTKETAASLKQKTEKLKDIINKNLEGLGDSKLQDNGKTPELKSGVEALKNKTEALQNQIEQIESQESGMGLKNELQNIEDELKDIINGILSLDGIEADIGRDDEGTIENTMENIIEIIRDFSELLYDENIEALVRQLEDIDVSSVTAVKDLLDVWDELSPLLKLKDLEEQLKSLIKVIDNTEKKLDGNNKLKADGEIAALMEQLSEIKDTAAELAGDIQNAAADGQDEGYMEELQNKTAELAADMENIQDKLSDAANNILKPPVEMPKLEEIQQGTVTENENPLIAEHLKLYSESDKAKARADMKLIEADNKNCVAIEPWRLIFRDYRVKLLSPVIKFGKEIYVPVSELTRQMGSNVIHEKAASRIVIKDKGVLIEFEDGGKEVYINDRRVQVSPEVQYISGQFYIPLSCVEKAYSLTDTETSGYTIVTKR